MHDKQVARPTLRFLEISVFIRPSDASSLIFATSTACFVAIFFISETHTYRKTYPMTQYDKKSIKSMTYKEKSICRQTKQVF